MLGTVSSDSIRCTNFINSNESDLRISSVDNTCTDSLVTALDDEALLICDASNEMARTKVNQNEKPLKKKQTTKHEKKTIRANTTSYRDQIRIIEN